ncbi:hypothetical protein [Oryza sativa Japonica Group]|uniref:Uncharacterized protein OSJNBa0025P13.21 n=1 Tax=Oryza sativa subsp. japonica TaxID=39947 RepID=Q5JNG9_ORYSJ|nr:hypothetical protein [Oryza sativa Japonica Group]
MAGEWPWPVARGEHGDDFLAILALKPGMDLTGTDIPTPGVSTPAPARDESQEALIIPTGRGEACDRQPVAT